MARISESPPLSVTLRQKAKNIESLLKEYEELRYGDELWRFGDELWRRGETATVWLCEKCQTQQPFDPKKKPEQPLPCPNCKNPMKLEQIRIGTPPHTAGKPPQITVSSSPRNIFYESEEDASSNGEIAEPVETIAEEPRQEKQAVNPIFQAFINLNELSPYETHEMELEKRYNLLTDMGIDERRNCAALIPWLRKLASELTYIFETRELYSPEIKAVYPELLTNLEVAIATCDQLAHLLGKQGGVLTRKQYDELMVKLLHYTQISMNAALQLADYHEEFMGGATSPFAYETIEAKYVLETEEEKAKKLASPEVAIEEEKRKEEKE
ncbi:MAG: hypothetical protein QW734_02050 [Candidatus Bathyarchaeia archaeon]